MAGADSRKKTLALVMPYAAWMAIMSLAPANAVWYAVRGVVTAILLGWAWLALGRPKVRLGDWKGIVAGIAVGVAIFLVWIAPETWFGIGKEVAAAESAYSPEVCGWALTIAKLAASALVIATAEELFFRRWLVDFAGFWWMVGLFAVEHGDRWAVGAVTGVVYGLLSRKFGLYSSISAHITTNLVLGFWVIFAGRWQFW